MSDLTMFTSICVIIGMLIGGFIGFNPCVETKMFRIDGVEVTYCARHKW